MLRILAFLLILFVVCSVGVTWNVSTPTVETATNFRSIADAWAPVIHQDVDDTDANADYITRFDFDGDFQANNNWENQPNYPLYPYVYYWVVETQTHWFVGYALFHPRDWVEGCPQFSFDSCHENDMEGMLLTIRRDGSATGAFQAMTTISHFDLKGYTTVQFDDGRPIVLVEAKGHGIFARRSEGSLYEPFGWPSTGFPGGDGVTYRYAPGVSEIPNESIQTQTKSYDLIDIQEIWDVRNDNSADGPFYSFDRFRGGRGAAPSNQNFALDAASPPWGWTQGGFSAPMLFCDPSSVMAREFPNLVSASSGTASFNPGPGEFCGPVSAPYPTPVFTTQLAMATGDSTTLPYVLNSPARRTRVELTHASDVDVDLIGPNGPAFAEVYHKSESLTILETGTAAAGSWQIRIRANRLTSPTVFVNVTADAAPDDYDTQPPSISGSRTPLPNGFGFNNSDVTVHFECADAQSGILYCTPDVVLSFEGRNQAVTGTAVDNAGNSASTTVGDINIDKTAPNTAHSLNPPTPNGKRNWYISDVTVTLNQSDPLLSNGDQPSGVQVTKYRVNGGVNGEWADYIGPFVVSTESHKNVVEYYSIDKADNQQATQSFEFKLDKTPPEITIDAGETDDIIWDQAHLEHGILANDPILNIDCNATDNLDLYEVRAVDVDSGDVLDSELVHSDPPTTQYDCQLQIPLHTGINTIDLIAEDCAGWEDRIRIQVVYVVPGQFDPRSKGFWSEAVKTKKYTDKQINTFLSHINVASDVWGNDASRNRYGPLTIANYKTILTVPDSAAMEQKMKAQLLADWLNMVSGRLAVKRPVNVSPIARYSLVMDDIGGNPLTYAYRVTLEIEEKAQPPMIMHAVAGVAKNLAEAINLRTIIVP